jgi:hypothetical protein
VRVERGPHDPAPYLAISVSLQHDSAQEPAPAEAPPAAAEPARPGRHRQ